MSTSINKKNNKHFVNEASLAIFELINKHFWKSKVGPISALVLPLFFMICYKIVTTELNNLIEFGLSTYLSFCILPICLISLPQIIVDLKTSIILRKISTSPISAWRFCAILLGYYLLANLISIFIVLIFFMIFTNTNFPKFAKAINWWELIYVLFFIILSSLSFGLFLGTIIKKNNLVQIIGVVVLIISCAFSGQLIPIQVLATTPAMRYIPLFSPLSYSLSLLNNVLILNPEIDLLKFALINPQIAPNYKSEELKEFISLISSHSIFDLKHPFAAVSVKLIKTENNQFGFEINKIKSLIYYEPWQKGMNLVMPYCVIGAFLSTSILKFNWTSR